MIGGRRIAAALAVTLALAAPAAAIGLSEEREIGARFALEARRRLPLLREPTVTAYLGRVGARLVARLGDDQFTYRFFVVADPTLNAFAVPGGYVYVHVGLLLRVSDEAELAGVLAHEIIHVDAHHVVRQQEKTTLVNYGTLLGIFLSLVHPALGAGAVSAGVAVQLKYQREFEQEADNRGLDLMRRAGFDPVGMPAFLQKVLRDQRFESGGLPPYFLSHPLTEDRLTQLEKRVGEMAHPAPRPGSGVELAAAQAVVRTLTAGRDSVLRSYRERLAAAPDDPVAGYLLGLVLLYAGQPDRAEPLLAGAVGTVPRARADHARALLRLGKAAEAAAELERHLATFSDDAPAEVELAKLRAAGGDFKRAAPLLEHALAGDPELDEAEYTLAECRGKTGDARGQWWHLGRAFELRGDVDRARSAYEKARDLSPENSPERKDVERALDMLRGTFGGIG
jgi:predicted Zn-dependent protease